jgi:hypothetical protein
MEVASAELVIGTDLINGRDRRMEHNRDREARVRVGEARGMGSERSRRAVRHTVHSRRPGVDEDELRPDRSLGTDTCNISLSIHLPSNDVHDSCLQKNEDSRSLPLVSKQPIGTSFTLYTTILLLHVYYIIYKKLTRIRFCLVLCYNHYRRPGTRH